MSIRKLRAGRVSTATASSYVGEGGTIFWNETTGEFRLSDGITPGGSRVGFPIASPTEIGGLKLGPGVTLNGQQQLIIDTAGLDFSFGDFYAFTNTGDQDGACLSSVNADQDVNIVSNGAGAVNVVGEFNIHKTNETVNDALSITPVFKVNPDGQIFSYVPTLDNNAGAFEIIGSSTGSTVAPGQVGTMLHVTGQLAQPARIYVDGNGDYVSIVARRWNGSISEGRTQVLANNDVLRINATAQTDTSMPGVSMAQIKFTAIEDQTSIAQGSKIVFTATPLGASATSRVDVATITVADGITSTKFTGPLIGNVTGTVSGNAGTVTNGVYTTDTGTVTNTMLAGSIANNKLANSTISGVALGSNLAALTAGTYITSTGTYTGATARTFAVDATSTNTASKVVARDASGNFAAGTITANTTGTHTGLLIRPLRNAGVIADGGTLTIDFSTDSVITAEWGNGITLAYTNYIAGRIVKLMAYKTAGTGTDSMSLGGVTAGQVSSGSTTVSGNAGQTTFVEMISTSTGIAGLYIKL